MNTQSGRRVVAGGFIGLEALEGRAMLSVVHPHASVRHAVRPAHMAPVAPEAFNSTSLSIDPIASITYKGRFTATVHFTTGGEIPVGAKIFLRDTGPILGLATGYQYLVGEGVLDANGVAVITSYSDRTLKVGTHPITAEFLATTQLAGSTSAAVNLTVGTAPTSVAVTAQSASSTRFFDSFNMSATVTRTGASAGSSAVNTDNARVTFYLGSTSGPVMGVAYDHNSVSIGTSGDSAVFTATVRYDALAAMTPSQTPYKIVAVYSGNESNAASAPSSTDDAAAEHTVTRYLPTMNGYGAWYQPVNANSVFKLSAQVVLGLIGGQYFYPTGSITFFDGDQQLGTPVPILSADFQTLDVQLPAGTHTITAVYSGDSIYLPASFSFTQNVSVAYVYLAPSGQGARYYGNTTSLFVEIAGLLPGDPDNRPITLVDGENVYTAPVLAIENSPGGYPTRANFGFLTNLPGGVHNMVFSYPGDPDHTAASATFTLQVAKAGSNITLTSNAPDGLRPGEHASITATITNASNANTYGSAPTGVVDFYDEHYSYDPIGTVTLDATGKAVLDFLASDDIGMHYIEARYSGDGNFNDRYSPQSFAVPVRFPTTVSLVSGTASAVYGESVTFTATVASAHGAPGGTVTFFDGETALGSAQVVGEAAHAVFAVSLAGGQRNITARYDGNEVFAPSTRALVQSVHTAPTTLTLAHPPVTAFGSDIAFVTTLASGAGPAAPSGAITIKDEHSHTVATAHINSMGEHELVAVGGTVAGGSHTFTAYYSGDANYSTSTSQHQTQTITPVHVAAVLSASTVAYGQPVMLTATATVGATTTPAVGTMDLYVGAAHLATAATDERGVAVFDVPQLPIGSQSLTVRFLNSPTAVSHAVALHVVKAASEATLTLSTLSTVYRSDVTLSAAVTASNLTPTGTVTFHDGSAVIATVPLVDGVAQYVHNAFAVGTHHVSVTYSGDAHINASTSTISTLNVDKLTPIVHIELSTTQTTFGQSVAITPRVTSPLAGELPTGSIDILDHGMLIGTVSGSDVSLVKSLAAGAHQLTANYHGNTHFKDGASSPASLTVDKATPTATLTLSAASAAVLHPVTLTMNVSFSGYIPTGSVTVFDGETSIATVPLVHGVATLTRSDFAAGAHTLSFQYGGDANIDHAVSDSKTLTITKLGSLSALTFSSATPPFGQTVTLKAVIAGAVGAPTPTGSVRFSEGAALNVTVPLVNGVATYVYTPARGGYHGVTLTYNGNDLYNPSTDYEYFSSQAIAPNVSLVSSAASVGLGQPVTFTATVTGTNGLTPSGHLTFYAGNQHVIFTLVNGVAVFTTSTLARGLYDVVAYYSGDISYSAGGTNIALTVL